jgi:hypothetical protein
MSIIHLIVFVLQFFLFVPLFFLLFIKVPKDSNNKKVFLIVALIAICYAPVDAYFHRYLIMSDFYYAQGDWKKSGEVAEEGINYLQDKSEFYNFVYGRFSLHRKMKRAEKKINPSGQQNGPAVNQDIAVTQEDVDQEESVVNEEVTPEQEVVEQEEPVVDEEVSVEQEGIGEEGSVVDQEGTAEQDDVEQDDSAVDEEATETPEKTDEVDPKGAAAGE